jgi:hypothetical protein
MSTVGMDWVFSFFINVLSLVDPEEQGELAAW